MEKVATLQKQHADSAWMAADRSLESTANYDSKSPQMRILYVVVNRRNEQEQC